MQILGVVYVAGVFGVFIGMQGLESRCTFRHWIFGAVTWPISVFVLLGESICDHIHAFIEASEHTS